MDHTDLRAQSDVYYYVDESSLDVQEANGIINAKLNLASSTDGTIAQTLDLTLTVYQNGILRMLIEEPDVKRFRISQEGLPVVDEQLIPQDLTGLVKRYAADLNIESLTSTEGDEGW